MKKVIILSLCGFSLLPFSCVNPATVKTVTQLASLGIEVVSLLKSCTELSQLFSTNVAQVNKGMEEGIKGNRSVLDLGKYWEKYWGDIHSDFDNLKNKLYETDRVSQQYFAELDRNNTDMKNPALKAEDNNKNTKIKEEYKAAYAKAVSSLTNSQKLLQDGDDILLSLRNDVLRSALQNQISVLESISSQSKTLSQNINYFSTTCIPLFTPK
jgi:hypothetical protein